MVIAKGMEKIVLTEQEAKILEKAYDIAMDIRDESETIASDYAETLMDALSDLINDPEGQENYTIGYEKTVNKQVVLVAMEI